MISKKYWCILILLLVMPLVFATETQISVVAKPNQQITLNVLDVTTSDLLQNFVKDTDASGIATFTSTVGASRVDFYVIARVEGKIDTYKKFEGGYYTGSPLTLDLYDVPAPAPVVNDTNNAALAGNNTVNDTVVPAPAPPAEPVASENVSAGSAISGNVVSDANGGWGYMTYVIIGIAVIVLAVILFFFFKNRAGGSYEDYKPIRRDSAPVRAVGGSGGGSKDLEQAQRKIRELETQVSRLKNVERIKEVEKRLEADKREIELLKKGKV